MNNIGIWIDHQRAVLVSVASGQATTKTVDSHVPSHPHYSGQQDGGGEKRYEQRHSHHLDRFYDEVVGHLATPTALLIFGPGEAKLELKAHVARSKALATCVIDVETADTLTEPQIVAKVKAHFDVQN
jgi:stalled ribosome rescue protein Dom34